MSEREIVSSSIEHPSREITNKRTVEDDREGSASLSLLPALSMFATSSVSNPGSVISSSAPHTPPSASPTRSFDSSGNRLGKAYSSPYPYSSSSVHSTGEATSKSPLRSVEREEDEEEEDEIVLGYTPNYPTGRQLVVNAQQQPVHTAFSAQRSAILKINALVGTGRDSVLPALLHPSHHPRSLWTLTSHPEAGDEIGEQGYDSFVWAIFDSHEHALSALSALQAMHPPIAEPALESDLHPFSKLRKVDMKAWTARMTSYTPETYSPSTSNGYSPATYSPTNAYSPQNTYPPALYHQSNYHNHHNESKYEQEINTPIPQPVLPQPQSLLTSPFYEFGVLEEQDDHSTPIPPSYAPTAAAYSSEMNPTVESRKHLIDADGGVVFGGGRGVRSDEISADRHVGICAIGSTTPHSPPAAASITAVDSSSSVARSSPTIESGNSEGSEAGRDVDGRSQGLDGTSPTHAYSALKQQLGSRNQGHVGASESKSVREDETTPILHGTFGHDTNSVGHAPWNKWEEGQKGKLPSTWSDRDLSGPREESGLAPPSFGSSFVRDHLPSSSNLTSPSTTNFPSHVARPDSIGRTGGVDTSTNTKMPQMLKSGIDLECIEKTEWTATAGARPNVRPTPAETSFSPLPSTNDRVDYGGVDFDRYERRRLPPDQPSSFYSPLADARRAPDGDRGVKINPTPASAASQTSSNTIGIGASKAIGSVGYGSGSSFSLGRFSPMLGCPIRSQGVGEDQGCDDGGYDENGDDVLRARAGLNYPGFEDASTLQSSAPPSHSQSLQQSGQSDLQKQPFLHEYPPHSTSFFQQHLYQHQQQQQQQQNQPLPLPQQQQYTYPNTATYTHTNLGVAPPTAFRHGDWLCNMPRCGAHNFGRNVSCIMCGTERAAAAAANFGYATAGTGGAGRMQSSGGMSLSMGMGTPAGGGNELDGDYAHSLDGSRLQGGSNAGMGTGAHAAGLNQGRSNNFSSSSYSLGQQSTYIPVIPRFGGQHQNGAPQTTPGDLAMSSTLVQALGGISQVAAIQEAIKAHQSQVQSQDSRRRLGGNNAGFTAQRHVNNGGRDGAFSMSSQGGQLLIPTTLGNSPPSSLPQGPIVVQQNRSGRSVEADNGDGQGRNPNLMVTGMQQHHALSSMPSQYASQGHPMQQNNHLQHPLPPHPSISARLLNAFSPASAAIAAAAIPASKMPALLTPSGRRFAAGGRVQNISRDELNPLLMFWPDNEPFPLTSQIRPPAAVLMALGGVQGPPPPILNTGNKGPIDAQPGDWTCGKCDYLNWRRRRVCANCYPHAEGNTEGTKHSTNDVQERVALLASVIYQQQQQVQAQQRQIQSQQSTVAALASAPNGFISPPAPTSFISSSVGPGVSSQQQSYAEAPRRNETTPLSKMNSMSMQLLAQKYGYAIPPTNGLRSSNSMGSFEPPVLPLNLPPRMTHPSSSEGVMSRGFMDLNRNAPSFQPIRADGVSHFDGVPQRLRSSPPSSRSSFSVGSNSSFYKSANEPTPSPLPLLPAFLQEVVGETSESSSSSVHESPSPPSPSSTSSAFGNKYSGDPRHSEFVAAGLRRREPSSPASIAPQISNNIHRTASHSSIWTFGYPGDRKEGIRPV